MHQLQGRSCRQKAPLQGCTKRSALKRRKKGLSRKQKASRRAHLQKKRTGCGSGVVCITDESCTSDKLAIQKTLHVVRRSKLPSPTPLADPSPTLRPPPPLHVPCPTLCLTPFALRLTWCSDQPQPQHRHNAPQDLLLFGLMAPA